LVTFGCSYTYGLGLADCFIPPHLAGPEPSKFAWPQILANGLNTECVNMSKPGSSNKEILNTLLNFKFAADDIIIIMWTFIERWCKINNDASTNRVVVGSNPNVALQFDKVFTLDDLQLDFIYRANFAKMYLDNKNLKNYHMSVKPELYCPDEMPVWNAVDFYKISLTYISHRMPPALDVKPGPPHPGPIAHEILATALLEDLLNWTASEDKIN
jgi:hypothetical protein